jgi:hypothetical protein
MSNVLEVTDWIKDFELSATYDEKPETYKFDLLEAAVVLYDHAPAFLSIEESRVLDAIDQSVKDRAEAIRKFYTKQWFWTSLSSNRSMSAFRQRAHYLLESRTREVLKKDIGIYVKLPWFYEEDMIYNDFKKTLKTTKDIPTVNHGRNKVEVAIKFLRTSNGWQGKRRTTKYWFKDDSDYLYCIDLEMTNPLMSMFDEAVKERGTCKFETVIQTDRIDQLYFYKLHQYKLLKETNEIS